MPAIKCVKDLTEEGQTLMGRSSGIPAPWEEAGQMAAEGLWVLEDLLDDQGIISHLQEILFSGNILGCILG